MHAQFAEGLLFIILAVILMTCLSCIISHVDTFAGPSLRQELPPRIVSFAVYYMRENSPRCFARNGASSCAIFRQLLNSEAEVYLV